jgi:hypothetical protein
VGVGGWNKYWFSLFTLNIYLFSILIFNSILFFN